MDKEINKKETVRLTNLLYKERFQFILKLNNDVICQRFFKVNGLAYDALDSEEMKLVMDEAVRMIQNDLLSKSRVYEWYTTPSVLKLTGFADKFDEYEDGEKMAIFHYNGKMNETIHCQNGDTIEKSYINCNDDALNYYIDNERPADNEFVFSFTFMFDDKVMYERIWDGNIYQKYIRNGVDIANSDYLYKDKDTYSLPFLLLVLKAMTSDKCDLVYHIIRKICYTLSSSFTEDGNTYTKKVAYGDKNYYYTTYNREYVNGWRSATEQKTKNYFNNLFPSEKKIEYIDKYL